jgi:hypothetical protein
MALSIRKKLAITSPTSGGRSVGIVCSRTQTVEFSFSFKYFFVEVMVRYARRMSVPKRGNKGMEKTALN